MNKLLLFLILLLGLTLRTWHLTDHPAGFSADEASHGYDAYSLLQTGKDQWGATWPLSFRSFGDFKLPVYSYLTIPFIYFLGLNELSVRLPGALFGTLAILATYFFTQELYKNKNSNSYQITKLLPITSAIFLAISPWHIQLSRGAFEANLTSFFLPLGLWAWLKSLQKFPSREGPSALLRRGVLPWWLLSSLFLGINLYTYHAGRAFTLIIFGLIIWFTYQLSPRHLRKFSSPLTIFCCSLFIWIIPLSWSVIAGEGSARGLDVAIFNPTDHWTSVFDQRHEAIINGLPTPASQLIYNKGTSIFQTFTRNYLSYLSPNFLFFNGPSESTYGMTPGIGVLLLIELPFILVALISFIRRPTYPSGLVILLILLSILPASLTKGDGSAAGRATTMLPFIHILSAYGLALFLNHRIQNHSLTKAKILFSGFLVLVFFSFFVENYLFHAPRIQAQGMPYGWKTAIHTINQLLESYPQIIISRSFSEPQIYPMFYTPISPSLIQDIAQTEWLSYQSQVTYLDQLGEYHLGNYTFRGITREDLRSDHLLVGQPIDFPPSIHTIQTIYRPDYPDPAPAIMIVDPTAAGLLIIHQNYILLTQSPSILNSAYGLPAGFATATQSRLTNALSELSQTSGLEISPSSCQLLPDTYPQSVHRPDQLDSFAVYIFNCEISSPQPIQNPLYKWFPITDLSQIPLLSNIPSAIKNSQDI